MGDFQTFFTLFLTIVVVFFIALYQVEKIEAKNTRTRESSKQFRNKMNNYLDNRKKW